MRTIDNLETSDTFVAGLTLEQDDASALLVVVANKSVRASLRPSRRETGGDDSYGAEFLLTPQATQIAGVSGARFRSAEAGQPARVIAILTGEGDPQFLAGVPFLSTLSAAGQLSGADAGGGVTGDIVWTATADLREGSVPCDGSLYNSIADPSFANLFAKIGTLYGGTGATSFAVPDLRGRGPVMLGAHPDVDVLGDSEGAGLANRSPSHSHDFSMEGSGSNGANPSRGNTLFGATASTSGGPLKDKPAFLTLYAHIVK